MKSLPLQNLSIQDYLHLVLLRETVEIEGKTPAE